MSGEVDAKLREKGLTSDRIDEFRVAFQMFDIEGVGYITADNIGALLIGQFGGCFSQLALSKRPHTRHANSPRCLVLVVRVPRAKLLG